jgi:putative ABC transport system permease protein
MQFIRALFGAAIRRLWANAGLVTCALLALIATVAIAVCVPVYAEGASLRLLREEIARQERQTGRSPFALLFRYLSSQRGTLEWDRLAPADSYLTGEGLQSLGLPSESVGRHVRSEQLRLFAPQGSQNAFLRNTAIGFIGGMDAQINVVDGTFPQIATAGDGPIEALMARNLADQIGVNVGDRMILVASGNRPASLQLVISGLWQPTNPRDPTWFFDPATLDDVLLVPEQSFSGPIATTLRGEVAQALWYVRLSGEGLNSAQASPLLSRIEAVQARAAGLIPGLRLEISPRDALARYRQQADELTVQLGTLSVPILGLVLYFAALVAGMLVSRQRSEIALLKTRGVRDSQILGVSLIEWLLLGGLALLIGPPIGLRFAEIMGRTASFLSLTDNAEPLAVALTWENMRLGIVAVLLALIAALLPAAAATRRTLVDEQQQAARQLRPPLWQRFYLDILLLLPPGYGIYQLRQSGGLQLAGLSGSDPFANPLLLLVPLLFCFASGLVLVRFIPMIFAGLAHLANRPTWVAPLVALRNLARQPATYRGALLLLILTLSMATFSASLAATIAGSLQQSVTYQVGAYMRLFETGESTERPTPGNPNNPNNPGTPPRRDIQQEPRFLFVPVSDHLRAEGVTAATRVGQYEASIQAGSGGRNAQLIGIDRLDFPKVIPHFPRAWGGGDSLGALMNLLARYPDGVIVSRNTLNGGLKIGDRLPLQLRMYGDQRSANFRIIAAVDLWPGFYPQDGPILVANLDYIFDQMGGQYPYDVWIARDSATEPEQVVDAVRGLGIAVLDHLDREQELLREQTRPQRQGMFGLLSVGFVTSGVLTLIGFLLAALIGARRRAIELGVLRAIGLNGGQVAVALGLEQIMVVVAGLGAGTGIGLLAATLVVPLLQAGSGPYPGTPAYAAQVAWSDVTIIYVVFGLTLLLVLAALGIGLARMQLFQAVKLGDSN